MKTMTTTEVQQLIQDNPQASLIDVRETEEVEAGKIPGIVHIPLGQLESRLEEIDQSKEHIIVCRSGKRSGMATDLLEEHGYDATNMEGGMLDWQGDVE